MELLYRAARFASDVLSGALLVLAILAGVVFLIVLTTLPYYAGWHLLDWMFK